MKPLLISACLTGVNCKYNGGNNSLPAETLERLRERYELIPVCPESDGGLPTPRDPSERVGDRIVSSHGADVTEQFLRGAELALETAKKRGCDAALLKELSPSCGNGKIYDGSFSHTVVSGDGAAAELLKNNGICVYGEGEADRLF